MPTILIVDDSKTARGVIRIRLGTVGYASAEILEAGNGTEALEIMDKRSVDVLITDVEMPVMDGLVLIAKMKSKPLLKLIPIIVVSAMEDRQKQELFEKGVNRILFKPAFEPALKEAVGACLAAKGNPG
ncbi:MAG: response regulator [Candidatus Ozemobacteraceae bacterium]